MSETGEVTAAHVHNPWTMPVSQVATVLRRSPTTIRRWCADGWNLDGAVLAKKIGRDWMIHGQRLAAYLEEAA